MKFPIDSSDPSRPYLTWIFITKNVNLAVTHKHTTQQSKFQLQLDFN